MYDYYLGGTNNFPADREAAERVLALLPHGPKVARVNRKFMARVVTCMAENGIDQFIDLGAGIPTSPNVHEIARAVTPGARVVYVDNDPTATTLSAQVIAGDDGGVVARYGDIRDPEKLFDDRILRDIIDFDRPVGVLVLSALHFLTELDDPQGSVSIVKARMAPGSFLAISHAISDGTATDMTAMIEGTYARAKAPVVFRTETEVRAFFAGLELMPPGLANTSEWRRARGAGRRQGGPPSMCIFGGVGKKPTGRSEGRG
jgi:hypothetical protein